MTGFTPMQSRFRQFDAVAIARLIDDRGRRREADDPQSRPIFRPHYEINLATGQNLVPAAGRSVDRCQNRLPHRFRLRLDGAQYGVQAGAEIVHLVE